MNAKVLAARSYADGAHSQTGFSYGDRPYVAHLDEVMGVLVEFGFTDTVLLQAAALHDILEDTPVDKSTLMGVFGNEVAHLVWLVTDEPGQNRRERKRKTYPKIASDLRSVTLKLADRIANFRATKVEGREDLMGMYRREYFLFRKSLYQQGYLEEMWAELDRLHHGS